MTALDPSTTASLEQARENNAARFIAAQAELATARERISRLEGIIYGARYCLSVENESAAKVCLDGNGLAPGVADDMRDDVADTNEMLRRAVDDRDAETKRADAERARANECAAQLHDARGVLRAAREQMPAVARDACTIADAYLASIAPAEDIAAAVAQALPEVPRAFAVGDRVTRRGLVGRIIEEDDTTCPYRVSYDDGRLAWYTADELAHADEIEPVTP